ncbi:MAG: hypothetical protein IV100_01135 [Myxococcales bacterium]|nr:hypothetical protein [Myxococcales bacterium]
MISFRSPRPRRLIVALTSAAALLTSACNQPERSSAAPPIDPRRPQLGARFEPISLDPIVLDTHADYDRWERATASRGGEQLVYTLYEQTLTHRRGTPRTFVRWVLLAYREPFPDELRQPLEQFIDALASRDDAGRDPDILYLLGYLGWLRVVGGAGSPASPQSRVLPAGGVRDGVPSPVAEVVVKNWGALVQKAPDWVGPYGVTARDLETHLATLRGHFVPVDAAEPTSPLAPDDLAGFHAEFALSGPKKACERLDLTLGKLGGADPTTLLQLGDAYAMCALERGNAAAAVTQLVRLLEKRVDAGYATLIRRIATTSPAVGLTVWKKAEADVLAADPVFAARNRLPVAL